MAKSLPKNTSYLYTVYRNKDDKMLALDVTGSEAAAIMGISRNRLDHIWSTYGGITKKWSLLRVRVKKAVRNKSKLHNESTRKEILDNGTDEKIS